MINENVKLRIELDVLNSISKSTTKTSIAILKNFISCNKELIDYFKNHTLEESKREYPLNKLSLEELEYKLSFMKKTLRRLKKELYV